MGSYLRIISVALGLAVALGVSFVAFREDGPRYQLVTIRGQTFSLEVAMTPQMRLRGLRGRSSLGADEGMLIPPAKPELLSYSTRYTPFPVDVLYLDGEGQVVGIDHLAANDDRLTASSSKGPVAGAVLLRGGTASMMGIERGYRFHLGSTRRRSDQ